MPPSGGSLAGPPDPRPAATHHPLSVWDSRCHDFVVRPGAYTVYIGTSADEAPHTARVVV